MRVGSAAVPVSGESAAAHALIQAALAELKAEAPAGAQLNNSRVSFRAVPFVVSL